MWRLPLSAQSVGMAATAVEGRPSAPLARLTCTPHAGPLSVWPASRMSIRVRDGEIALVMWWWLTEQLIERLWFTQFPSYIYMSFSLPPRPLHPTLCIITQHSSKCAFLLLTLIFHGKLCIFYRQVVCYFNPGPFKWNVMPQSKSNMKIQKQKGEANHPTVCAC